MSSTNRKMQRTDDASTVDDLNKRIKTSDDSDDETEQPEYKPGALARDVFGDPYFYIHVTPEKRQDLANDYESARKKCFGEKTVKVCLESLQSENDVRKVFKKSGVDIDKVVSFWEMAKKKRKPEEVLHGRILSVTAIDEITTINERYVDLSSFRQSAAKNPYDQRTNDIRFVLGPSGSGKTFFAVKVVAVEGMEKPDDKWVTVYFNLKKVKLEDAKKSDYMLDNVKHVLQSASNNDLDETLQLTLSLVLDEAGSTHLEEYFEDSVDMDKLYGTIRPLATKFRLIICGTGLVAHNFSTGPDALKYRMKPWVTKDLEEVNKARFALPKEALEALQLHPNLQALTTNARAAWFLLQRATSFLKADKIEKIDLQQIVDTRLQQHLVNHAPNIVTGVVADYISHNGIQNLNDTERRRVAAAVFNIIENNERNVPTKFPGLLISNEKEQDVASSLVSINIEIDSKKKITLVQGEVRPFSISPALTMVLYWMCGIPTPMLSGWKAQELLSALYECRRFMRDCVNKYETQNIELEQYKETDLDRYKSGIERSFKEYNARLFSLQLIELCRRIPEPRANFNFYIPYVSNWTIWINKGMAPYADVVAPHALYQSKFGQGQGESSSLPINLLEELGKCGLLKDSTQFKGDRKKKRNESGWAITKSLDYLWREAIDYYKLSPLETIIDSESRFFYPDIRITWPPSAMECRYATLKYDNSEWWLQLPDPSETEPVNVSNDLNLSNNSSKTKPVNISNDQKLYNDLTFYITSNRKEITLTRATKNGPKQLKIKEVYLDNSGDIRPEILTKFTKEESVEWTYYQDILREKVKIRFLLS